MKETGVLFKEDMRQAKREGRKTQSRRVYKLDVEPIQCINPNCDNTGVYPVDDGHGGCDPEQCEYCNTVDNSVFNLMKRSPWGVPGDRIYVKEPHYLYGAWYVIGETRTGKPKMRFVCDRSYGVHYLDAPPTQIMDGRSHGKIGWAKRISLFMPKWCARDWATLTEVRVERVQDISNDDARAEGLYRDWDGTKYWYAPFEYWSEPLEFGENIATPRPVVAFGALWDYINKPLGHGWDLNEWVWAYTWENDEKSS